jgi:hypothetical protein
MEPISGGTASPPEETLSKILGEMEKNWDNLQKVSPATSNRWFRTLSALWNTYGKPLSPQFSKDDQRNLRLALMCLDDEWNQQLKNKKNHTPTNDREIMLKAAITALQRINLRVSDQQDDK